MRRSDPVRLREESDRGKLCLFPYFPLPVRRSIQNWESSKSRRRGVGGERERYPIWSDSRTGLRCPRRKATLPRSDLLAGGPQVRPLLGRSGSGRHLCLALGHDGDHEHWRGGGCSPAGGTGRADPCGHTRPHGGACRHRPELPAVLRSVTEPVGEHRGDGAHLGVFYATAPSPLAMIPEGMFGPRAPNVWRS